MYVTDTILRSSLRDIMRKAHEKFQSDPLSDFWKKVENCNNGQNYANLCIIMHPTDTILLISLRFILRKAHAKFQPDPLSGFWKKVKKL